MTDLRSLASLEGSGLPSGSTGQQRDRPRTSSRGRRRGWRPGRRTWLVLWIGVVAWALVDWTLVDGSRQVVNREGLGAFTEFWLHAVRPETSPDYLRATVDAAGTTVAFAVLGTICSVALGLLLAPLMSQTWWAASSSVPGVRLLRACGLLLTRVTMAVPRGVHEAVWALLLLSVLGRDPLVGVVAIAIPFGAITAKVYAELLDEADQAAYELLRGAGAGRLTALCYGLLPTLVPSLTSYAFYRFECAIRSAVILGMVGAGGLGLQLSLSFQGLQYGEMWTSILALVVLGGLVDRWGSALRRGTWRWRWQLSGVATAGLALLSVWHLAPDVSRWTSPRTVELLGRLVDDLVPPRLPGDGWRTLVETSVETLLMSVVAVTLAAVLGGLAALVAARGSVGWPGRVAGWLVRQLLLLTRAVPPPVWALLVLFVVFPGPLPGAIALGVYTFGILGRLFAEVVEELDPRPRDALTMLGARRTASFAYAAVPAAAGAMTAYSLYRWEVTARETVVVGVVGAGGLGRLLEQQRVAFDFPAMAGTVLALVVVCVLVDLVSMAVRSSLR